MFECKKVAAFKIGMLKYSRDKLNLTLIHTKLKDDLHTKTSKNGRYLSQKPVISTPATVSTRIKNALGSFKIKEVISESHKHLQ